MNGWLDMSRTLFVGSALALFLPPARGQTGTSADLLALFTTTPEKLPPWDPKLHALGME
jgi:hypothetical protein